MRYYKRIDSEGTTTTVEAYSHNSPVIDAIEIAQEEYDEFIASLPVVEPIPSRNYGVEIDEIKVEIEKLKAK